MPELDDIIQRLEALESLIRGLEERKRTSRYVRALMAIYTFRNLFSTMDSNWIFRAKEEEVAFRLFKNSEHGDLLPHFEDLRYSKVNKQIFYVYFVNRGRRELAEIKLPRLYPSLPPNSIVTSSGFLEIYTSHTHPDKCLGDIVKDKWDDKGRLGIPHWLLFVEVYLTLRERPVKL